MDLPTVMSERRRTSETAGTERKRRACYKLQRDHRQPRSAGSRAAESRWHIQADTENGGRGKPQNHHRTGYHTGRGIREGTVARQSLFLMLELSSQVQQRIEENLKRGLPAEAFARSTVEFGNEGCYLSLAEVLHINRLGTVFTD